MYSHYAHFFDNAYVDMLEIVLLELGGKSPAFVTSKADITKACKRIAWGKFCMNM
jgi:acyl-CoA reductase-like NAD-dependent aldehyde dehydrogenase